MRHCILSGTEVGVDTNIQVGEMVPDTIFFQLALMPLRMSFPSRSDEPSTVLTTRRIRKAGEGEMVEK